MKILKTLKIFQRTEKNSLKNKMLLFVTDCYCNPFAFACCGKSIQQPGIKRSFKRFCTKPPLSEILPFLHLWKTNRIKKHRFCVSRNNEAWSQTTENLDNDSSCVEFFRDLQLHANNKKVGKYILIFLTDFFQVSFFKKLFPS